MDRTFYAELEELLRDEDTQRKNTDQQIRRFLDTLEECVNQLTRNASGTTACNWGMKGSVDQFIKHQYQKTISGFDFELQISFYNVDRHPIFRESFSFSAHLEEDVIRVFHNEDCATVGNGSPYHTPSSLKEVADLLDKSLHEKIVGGWDPHTDL